MTALAIRAARSSDLPSLQNIFRSASLSNEGDRASLLAHPEGLEFPGGGIAEGRTWVAVAEDGTVVGFATTLPVADHVLELEDLFVDPERMRQGIATTLLEDLFARARRDGIPRIEVTANPHADAFYRSVGFTEDHQTITAFGPAARMSLTLDVEPGRGMSTGTDGSSDLIQRYAAAFAVDPDRAATDFYADDVVLRIPGRHRFAGQYRGRAAAAEALAALARATDNTLRPRDIRAAAYAANLAMIHVVMGATRNERTIQWERVIIYHFAGSRIDGISFFDYDTRALDDLLD
jgi:GNAT superfamily N-acetyltransferase